MIQAKFLLSSQYSKEIPSPCVAVLCEESKIEGLGKAKDLPASLAVRIGKYLARKAEKPKPDQIEKIPGMEKGESDIVLGILPKSKTSFARLGFSKNILKVAIIPSLEFLDIVPVSVGDEDEILESLGAALAIRLNLQPIYGKKAKEQKVPKLKALRVIAKSKKGEAFNYGYQVGEGTHLVRYLGALPPDQLDSGNYKKRIEVFVKEYKLQYKFYSKTELKKMGAGAFTAVDQGNPDSQGGIHEITYSPKSAKNKNPVVLVGKGLCYDTGGHDIKTGGHMMGMKGDMQGSAVALSMLLTASRLKWPLKMKAYLGVTENYLSPKAYKADEVVIALNGTSIEIINTDAEGRMVLADTLTLASRAKPAMIMDFATLTGMARYAIGDNYSAAFSNQKTLWKEIIEAGEDSGERVWPFPLDEDYGKALDSTIADTLQCVKGRGPDHIHAAIFLSKFVEGDFPWIHVDLAAADKEGGLAHVDSFFTGFGVKFGLELIRRRFKLKT